MDDSDREFFSVWYQEWQEDRRRRKFADHIANVILVIGVVLLFAFIVAGIVSFCSGI